MMQGTTASCKLRCDSYETEKHPRIANIWIWYDFITEQNADKQHNRSDLKTLSKSMFIEQAHVLRETHNLALDLQFSK